jgi:hypothetical protein
LTGLVILLLMKRAYHYLLKVKNALSVGKMLERFKDAHVILMSPAFKALESKPISPRYGEQ